MILLHHQGRKRVLDSLGQLLLLPASPPFLLICLIRKSTPENVTEIVLTAHLTMDIATVAGITVMVMCMAVSLEETVAVVQIKKSIIES